MAADGCSHDGRIMSLRTVGSVPSVASSREYSHDGPSSVARPFSQSKFHPTIGAVSASAISDSKDRSTILFLHYRSDGMELILGSRNTVPVVPISHAAHSAFGAIPAVINNC